MQWRSIHLVFGVAVLAVLGTLVVLAVRAVPAGEGSGERTRGLQRDETHSGSSTALPAKGSAGTHDLQPSDGNRTAKRPEVVPYRYKVVKTYPHDRRFFTQGLVYEDGFVYEGTGLYGQSALYKRDLQTGKIIKSLRLPDKYFGEGITLFGDKLIQLTWQSKVGFVYTKDTFTPLREFKYAGEGWGLTHDGRRLILSDGTAILRFLDPNTFAETGRIEVRDQDRRVGRLNELEYVADGAPVAQTTWRGRPALASRGHPGLAPLSQSTRVPSGVRGQDAFVTKEQGRDALATTGSPPQAAVPAGLLYANIWPTDQIVIIDPKTGHVTGRIDLSGLYTPPANEEGDSVLNGIAWLPESKHLLVTGKLWPKLYEIELTKKTP